MKACKILALLHVQKAVGVEIMNPTSQGWEVESLLVARRQVKIHSRHFLFIAKYQKHHRVKAIASTGNNPTASIPIQDLKRSSMIHNTVVGMLFHTQPKILRHQNVSSKIYVFSHEQKMNGKLHERLLILRRPIIGYRSLLWRTDLAYP